MVRLAHKFRIALYGATVHVHLTDDMKAYGTWFNKKYRVDWPWSETEVGSFGKLNKEYFIAYKRPGLTYNTVCHEIFHGAHRIAEHRAICDEEAKAWICGYLAEVIFKFLSDNDISLAHGSEY